MTEAPDGDDGWIRLPLRIYIVSGVELEQKRVKMTQWITPEQVENTVLPEINRIWKPAKIEWVLDKVVEQPAVEVPNLKEAITCIQNAKRDEYGKSDPTRMPHIHALCGKENGHPAINNLYFFPYMGQTSQGNAGLTGNSAFVGVWTDKPSGGEDRPKKFDLRERGRFREGSIARTSSHELGHNLGLEHPDKKTQKEFDRLMGGKKPGNELIPEEIRKAREIARVRVGKILAWAASE